VVLSRAGSASLKLEVEWPVEIGALELISSRDFPICSLSILYEMDENITPLTISSFQNLNSNSYGHFWRVCGTQGTSPLCECSISLAPGCSTTLCHVTSLWHNVVLCDLNFTSSSTECHLRHFITIRSDACSNRDVDNVDNDNLFLGRAAPVDHRIGLKDTPIRHLLCALLSILY
jgi:hypothetical protein